MLGEKKIMMISIQLIVYQENGIRVVSRKRLDCVLRIFFIKYINIKMIK